MYVYICIFIKQIIKQDLNLFFCNFKYALIPVLKIPRIYLLSRKEQKKNVRLENGPRVVCRKKRDKTKNCG